MELRPSAKTSIKTNGFSSSEITRHIPDVIHLRPYVRGQNERGVVITDRANKHDSARPVNFLRPPLSFLSSLIISCVFELLFYLHTISLIVLLPLLLYRCYILLYLIV